MKPALKCSDSAPGLATTAKSHCMKLLVRTRTTRKRSLPIAHRQHRQSQLRPLSRAQLGFYHRCLVVILLLSSWKNNYQASGIVCAEAAQIATEDDKASTIDPPPVQQVQDGDERKPYRSSPRRGRLRLVPTRRYLRVTTADDQRTSDWHNHRITGIESHTRDQTDEDIQKKTLQSIEEGGPRDLKANSGNLNLLPFLQRGLLLLALGSLALLERTPALVSSTHSPKALRNPIEAMTFFMQFPKNIRLNWTKMWSVPGEILPSISSALLIAWLPGLVFQGAWWELTFLFLSLTSQPYIRSYTVNEILPAMSNTIRKLLWSEFWKNAWDFLLEPFSHNLLIPQTLAAATAQRTGKLTGIWWESFADFWSNRVVSRIDKWTASSLKAVLQKNVQNSVDSLAEDSFQALVSNIDAYAWYGNNDVRRISSDQNKNNIRTKPTGSNDLQLAIEIEDCIENRDRPSSTEDDAMSPGQGSDPHGSDDKICETAE